MMKTYDMFEGTELEVADLIQRRRLQLLVNSCIYYEFNRNLVSDRVWDGWAKELVTLQKQYPEISSKVMWADAFSDWDGSTGAFLPIKNEWVIKKSCQLLNLPFKKSPPEPVKKTSKVRRLF